jgi:rRNA maturation protein Nop10
MRLMYHLCGNWDKKQVQELKKYRLDFKVNQVDCKEINENEYLEIKYLLDKWNSHPIQYPEFEKNEIIISDFSIINGTNGNEYPMPDSMGYKCLTYNTSEYCSNCGIGLIQNSPFRLKRVPNLKKKIFGLNWVYDELFVEKEYYKNNFEPLGIGWREVLLYKGDKVIENIVQLNLQTSEDDLDLNVYEYEICPKCGRKKYMPMPLGFFPIQHTPLKYLYKSKEYFGSGASADKKVFISKNMRNKLIEEKHMRWQWFIPCTTAGAGNR